MTQTIAQKNSLYDRDLNLWLETAIAQLKAGDLKSLDIENLIEELEGLAGRDRRELKTRLATLIEHLLKRCYVKSEYDYAGWVETIDRTRNAIRDILKQSPSLKNYVKNPDLFQEAFDDALRIVRRNQGYKSVKFPDKWQFSSNIDDILNIDFWEYL
ncbi:MAG: DUF29 domain-containing protein [Pseudanabaena sp. M135S2SP2A07QC]|jgi:hypothetical protein|nr:DUF29 domain-containing protein [Pseudanabaena sp. M090S1SP2A07QC]MCA6505729.1 DUF29 domain-containing protein [Pseudanabaena sp. M172S2SP2A07QC]MCA6509196.1 DUF29 domain-containing protein [Pseudanabaena sp. M109S1SP2A07QC]MCA6517829.1 DUF29 domain-containing protein [Pseudanabaena sp. M110S1SP2A07QC]MCA6521927.1 DUF29 domain-containing protein [Pseudanabaena sp. M051S1SP2A07QC]MCA6524492.1 DUF29 domain-containing protein [Pseudanabaena sp. M179S2SP2A07QC]MCA6528574.1 DUF29 domain-contain